MIIVPNSYGSPVREYNKCHEPGGQPSGGQFAPKGACGQSSDLAVHIEAPMVKVTPVYDSWGKPRKGQQPLYYEAEMLDGSGRKIQLKGRPLSDWERANSVLYHVTTNLEGVLGSGEITAFEGGGGLGGGQHPAVSFTANRQDALNILNVLTAATRIANYEDPMTVLREWAEAELTSLTKTTYPPQPGDSPRDRIPYSVLNPVYDGLKAAQAQYGAASGDWRKAIGREGSPYEIKSEADAKAEAGIDALRTYLQYRDSAKLGKNPVLFARARTLRKAKTLGILVVPGREIPKNVLVNVGADSFQNEVEVHGDVPISRAYYLSRKKT